MAKVILLLIVFGVLQATFSAPSDGKKNNAYLLYEIYTPIGSLKKFRLSQTTIHRQSFFLIITNFTGIILVPVTK